MCGGRAEERARGGPGPGPAPASLRSFKVSGRALPQGAGTPSWAARSRARAATGGLAGAGPAAPRPAPPLAPVRLSARTRTHPRADFHVFWEKSEVPGAGAGGGESSRHRLGAKPARSPPRLPLPPQAPGSPEAGPGLAPTCAAGGEVSLLLLKDERRHGRLCRFSGLLLPPPPLLHIQVENFQEPAETLCPKKTESRLPPNPGALPGKLPFGRKYWGICLFIGREMIPRGEKISAFLLFVRSSNICFDSKVHKARFKESSTSVSFLFSLLMCFFFKPDNVLNELKTMEGFTLPSFSHENKIQI